MVAKAFDLWTLVRRQSELDPRDLARAVQEEAGQEELDYRTKLLIRDSVTALKKHWGRERLDSWLSKTHLRSRIEDICAEEFERPGFPSLEERIMDKTDPDEVRRYLRTLGSHLHRPIKIVVGGSMALILPELISRRTDDIDVVDEVPAEIRTMHKEMGDLRKEFGLALTHFQSHYLPDGWQNRLHSLEPFGQLQVFLVDPCDVFVSKLFSGRTKDMSDLRVLTQQLKKDVIVDRLQRHTASLRKEEKLLERAQKNWYILYGEPLPS